MNPIKCMGMTLTPTSYDYLRKNVYSAPHTLCVILYQSGVRSGQERTIPSIWAYNSFCNIVGGGDALTLADLSTVVYPLYSITRDLGWDAHAV